MDFEIFVLMCILAVLIFLIIKTGRGTSGKKIQKSKNNKTVSGSVKFDFDIHRAYNNMMVWMAYKSRHYEYHTIENSLQITVKSHDLGVDEKPEYKFYIRAFDERYRDVTLTTSRNTGNGKYKFITMSSGEFGYEKDYFPSDSVIYDHETKYGVDITSSQLSCLTMAGVILYEFEDIRKVVRREIFGYNYLEIGFINDELYKLFKYAYYSLVKSKDVKHKDFVGDYRTGNTKVRPVYDGYENNYDIGHALYFTLKMHRRMDGAYVGKYTLLISQRHEDIIEISAINGDGNMKNRSSKSFKYHVGGPNNFNGVNKLIFDDVIATLSLFDNYDNRIIYRLNRTASVKNLNAVR